MSSFQAVVQQLQKNNQEEATRDNTMVKSLELHGEQNRVGFNKLLEKITGELDGVKNTFEGARAEEAEKNKEQKKLKGSKKEEENRVLRFMKITATGLKNLPGNLTNAVKKGMGKLMDTMKEYGKKGWAIAKKFLMVGALGVLLAFMNSKLWTQVTETLGKIKDGFLDMWDGLKEISAAFWDEDGNLDIIAGIKKTWEKVTAGFQKLSDGITNAFFDEEGNYRTDNVVGQLTLIATGLIGITLAWKTLRFAIDGFKLALAPAKFFGSVFSSGGGGGPAGRGGKGGLFTKAMGGIKSGWKALGSRMSGFKTTLMDIGANWGETSKNAKKSGGWASKGVGGLRGRFGRLFRMVGKRGLLGLIAGAGVSMLALLDFEKTKGIFSDAAGGLTKIFGKAFDVVKNFGSSISDVAKSAASKLKSVVSDTKKKITGDADKPRTKRPEEIEAEKRKAAQNDAELKKKQAANLEKTRAKNAAIKNKKMMDAFKVADVKSMKNFEAAQKAAKELADKAAREAAEKVAKESAKSTAEVVAKAGTKSLIKKIPIISIGAGLLFGAQRALAGDFTGAGLEVLSGVAATVPVAGTALSAGADATLLAKDLGAFDGKTSTADGSAIEDVKSPYYGAYQDGRSYIQGGDSISTSQTFTTENLTDGNGQVGTWQIP